MIEFHAFPTGRPVAVTHAVRLADGPTILVGAGGRLYSTNLRRGKQYSHLTYITETTLRALVVIGALSEAEAQAHRDAVIAGDMARDAWYNLDCLRRAARDTGVAIVQDDAYRALVELAAQYREVE